MIHTLTLNTAIDMNIFCDPLQPAAVNRTRQTEYCPNGKGVNVSLVLHHYQQPTHVMGIFGGFTGRYIVEELRKQHINVTPAWVAEPTRINIFINDGSDEYKLVNPGARIDDEGKEQILHHLQCVAPGDYLVISGSLPPGIESRFYSEILVLCQQKGCEVILDISHPVLRQFYLDYMSKTGETSPPGDLGRTRFELSMLHPAVLHSLAEHYKRSGRLKNDS